MMRAQLLPHSPGGPLVDDRGARQRRRRIIRRLEQPLDPRGVGGSRQDGVYSNTFSHVVAAIASVTDATAPLLAEYNARFGSPTTATTEQVLTIAA